MRPLLLETLEKFQAIPNFFLSIFTYRACYSKNDICLNISVILDNAAGCHTEKGGGMETGIIIQIFLEELGDQDWTKSCT